MQRITVFLMILLISVVTVRAEEDMYTDADIVGAASSISHDGQQNLQTAYPDFDFAQISAGLTSGDYGWNPAGILNRLLRLFFNEIYVNVGILIRIITIAILCALITNLQSAFAREGVTHAAFLACYALLVGVGVHGFTTAASISKNAIDDMMFFVNGCLPPMAALLVGTGAINSASTLQPVILVVCGAAGALIKAIVIPLIYASMGLELVNNISEKVSLSRLCELMNGAAKWLIGIAITLFVGLISISGFLSGALDGVTSRTAKFAMDRTVPMVGGMLGDALDAVAGSALLIKNTAGMTGILFIILLGVLPLVKLGALNIIYKLAAAVLEPVVDKRFTKAVWGMSRALGLFFALTFAVTVLLVIALAVVIAAGNIGVMMR